MPELGDIRSSRWAQAPELNDSSAYQDNSSRSTPKARHPREPRSRGSHANSNDKATGPTATTSLFKTSGLGDSRWAQDDSTVMLYIPTQTIVLDEEGDTLMLDFNDPSVAEHIVGALGGERQSTSHHILEHDDNSDSRIRAPVLPTRWVMVLDTNFLLSDLPLVGKLLEGNRDWGNVLMVPWAVIMELDGLKRSSASTTLRRG
ncbi:hypothetical protein BZA77DRAFT_365138 [Pyronema omphalodes]|nr:hypothetical protein BZA77DRAFT_365138 [Pyronema omphalodes]